MAQLLKILDYVSRYEIDLNRYPTQFVRLKRQQWERTLWQWQNGGAPEQWLEEAERAEERPEENSFFSKLFRRRSADELLDEGLHPAEREDAPDALWMAEGDEEGGLDFGPLVQAHPKTLLELKRVYAEQVFQFQLKWASSTLLETSFVDPKYSRDPLLRLLTQSLPDQFLLLYYPILKLKKAPVELDIILLTPTACYCITAVEAVGLDVFVGDSSRFWVRKSGKAEKKMLSPLIALNRNEAILSQLLAAAGIQMPVRKVLLSRTGYFNYSGGNPNTAVVDKRTFMDWILQMRASHSPMKHMQLKAAQTLLDACQTTSFLRSAWGAEEVDLEEGAPPAARRERNEL